MACVMENKQSQHKLVQLFDNVYPARRRIMDYLPPTDLSTFAYALGLKITERERHEFLEPIRDIPTQRDWIRSESQRGTRISLLGRDVRLWLLRLTDPKAYWSMFQRHPMLRVWILTRRSLAELDQICCRIRVVQGNIQTIGDGENWQGPMALESSVDSIMAYGLLLSTDPRPSGSFSSLRDSISGCEYRDKPNTELDSASQHEWFICQDAASSGIDVLYMNTHMETNAIVNSVPHQIVDPLAQDDRVGCISLGSGGTRYHCLEPTKIARQVAGMTFDVAIPAKSMSDDGLQAEHYLVDIGC